MSIEIGVKNILNVIFYVMSYECDMYEDESKDWFKRYEYVKGRLC